MGGDQLRNQRQASTLGGIDGDAAMPFETLPLTKGKRAGLQRLSKGNADYFDIVHAGANGAAMAQLVSNGLARELGDGFAEHEWEITEAGRQALANGWFVVTGTDS